MRSLSIIALAASVVSFSLADAQPIRQTSSDWRDAFRQLEDEDWPSPNRERRATGAPGPDYWQQDVDYDIDVHLNERTDILTATETVTYTNNAPDTLDFLWFLLDQNRFRPDSMANVTATAGNGAPEGTSAYGMRRRQMIEENGYGFNITAVTDASGEAMDYTIVDTLMRIDLDDALETGDSVTFTIEWNTA